LEFLFYCNTGAPQGTAGNLRPHRMKFLLGRMLGGAGTAHGEPVLHTGSLESLAAA